MPRSMILLALALAGCASSSPAPISYGGSGSVEAASAPHGVPDVSRAPPPAQAPAPDWAAGEGAPLSAYALQPEEAHPFDPMHTPRTHRVGPNESLYDIATTYQTPLRALIDQNHLEPPYALTPGSVLELPPPRVHVVERGESFRDVALAYNVDPRSLALLNRLAPPYDVRPGDRIALPAMARSYETPISAIAPAQSAASQRGGRFVWPLRGDVVAGFGAQSGGSRLDGIEIAGREGAPIAAAEQGEVVYAGADLPAYGTLVLLRHADGYVTAYGFARRALVREGEHVRAGEPIAELGARPDGRPRLLFQVRRGREVVDPTPLLGSRG